MTDKDRKAYILFLRSLFKNQPYVQFALLTGILPIAKYSSGSPLNMFHEFNSFARIGFEEYYGFSEEEITNYIARHHVESPSIEEIQLWYDGYVRRSDSVHMFNPDSVYKALTDGYCMNHWAGTGPMNDISSLIAANAFEIRNDIVRMTAGEQLNIELDGFSVECKTPKTKEDILSAMVVYGFLTYHDGLLSIPNLELAQKFTRVLKDGTLGISIKLEESRTLLNQTISGNNKQIALQIENIHDEQIPFIQYSDENSLACVIMLAYYAALDYYDIKRELPSGKGYVDFLFRPIDHRHIPIVMELKYNHSAKSAIAQIRKNNSILSLKDYKEVLFVGINYSQKTKKHTCLIETTSYSQELAKSQQFCHE